MSEVLKLDFVHTLAFSGIVLFIGYWLRRLIRPLARYNIPAPVIGGLLIALATLVARDQGIVLLKNFVVLLVAMWAGYWLSQFFISLGFTLPAYIGAMFVAAFIRNFDDLTHAVGLSQKTIDDIGNVALSLFLAMALMSLRLWDLAGLVLPLLIILIAQVVLVVVVCFWPLFQIMGRDYESAVIGGGFIGFMLGTMANSMAVMKSIVERYGKAPRAFLAVPMMGAFLVDFTNAMIITIFLNIFR